MNREGRIQGERELFARLASMTAQGQQGILATVIKTHLSTPRHEGSKMIIHPDGSITGTVGGGTAEAVVMAEAKQVLQDGQCRLLELDLASELGVCGGKMEVFLEPVLKETPLIIIGGGHVGRALVDLGQHLNLRIILIDDRPEFLDSAQGIPGVKTFPAGPQDLAPAVTADEKTAVVVASRNHDLDGKYLTALLDLEAESGRQFGFLGVLGSQSKAARLKQRISQETPRHESRLATLQMPVGLDTGPETPQEIALSILAEALAVMRGVPYLRDEKEQPLGLRLHRRRQKESGS